MKSKLEENLDRIYVIQRFADLGICDEYQGIIKECPYYADDCPQTCTYAREKK